MAYGIDSIVQDKADAYRSNPEKLMQSYQANNQQLVDLLALQKIKSEQEAYARDMQAQMQPTAGTIDQQIKQQVMGNERQRVAQQLQQGGQQVALNQQRQAQPAGLPAQPAPNMQGMAMGGIVGYQEGGFMGPPEANMLQRMGQGLKNYGANAQESMGILKEAKAGMGVPYEDRSAVMKQVRDEIAAQNQSRDPNFIERMGQKLMGVGLNVEESKAILKKFYDNMGKTYEQKANGMAQGGIVGYQDGGDVELDPETGEPIDRRADRQKNYNSFLGTNRRPARDPRRAFEGSGLAALQEPPSYEGIVAGKADQRVAMLERKVAEQSARGETDRAAASMAQLQEAQRQAQVANRALAETDKPTTTTPALPVAAANQGITAKDYMVPQTINGPSVAPTDVTVPTREQSTLQGIMGLPRETPLEKRMREYEKQYGGSERGKLDTVADFLMGVGRSGATNIGAALTGGGSGVEAGASAERARKQAVADKLIGMEEERAAAAAKATSQKELINLEYGFRDKIAQDDIRSRASLAEQETMLELRSEAINSLNSNEQYLARVEEIKENADNLGPAFISGMDEAQFASDLATLREEFIAAYMKEATGIGSMGGSTADLAAADAIVNSGI